MKVLVSTKGDQVNDFCWTNPAEIVMRGFVCDNGCDCGCARAMTGVETLKGTTTMTVADRPDIKTRKAFKEIIWEGWQRSGFTSVTRRDTDYAASKLMDFCSAVPVGAIVRVIDGELAYNNVRVTL